MKYNLGENIKRLRLSNNITQETMAEYLHVSYQTVSKWETGTSLPSVTILPSIANMFNVSIDELYDPENHTKDELVKQYMDEYAMLCSNGDNNGRVELMRRALAEFPRNYLFMDKLARSLYRTVHDSESVLPDEIFSLCERILDECTDDRRRFSALQTLARSYKIAGQLDKAIEYANMMPSIDTSRETILAEIYSEEEHIEQLQKNLHHFISNSVKILADLAYSRKRTPEERVQILEAGNTIFFAILDDNTLWTSAIIWQNSFYIALNYCLAGNKDKAIENILLAEKYAIAADEIFSGTGKKKFTSIFFDHVEYEPTSFTKHWEGSHRRNLFNKLHDKRFDPIRGSKEFKATVERLADAE